MTWQTMFDLKACIFQQQNVFNGCRGSASYLQVAMSLRVFVKFEIQRCQNL